MGKYFLILEQKNLSKHKGKRGTSKRESHLHKHLTEGKPFRKMSTGAVINGYSATELLHIIKEKTTEEWANDGNGNAN